MQLVFKSPQRTVGVETGARRLYTAAVILAPILSPYSRSGVSLGLLLVILAGLWALAVLRSKIRVNKELLIFEIYIILNWIVMLFLGQMQDPIDASLRTIQYAVIVFFLVFGAGTAFEVVWAQRFYEFMTVAASLFLVMQYVFARVFKVYISGLIQNSLFPCNDIVYRMYFDTPTTGRRVPGLFSEPANHCVYVLGALALVLFDNKIKPIKKYAISGCITLSIVCCASSTGMLTAGAIWGIYILYLLRLKGLTTAIAKCAMLAIVAVPVFLSRMSSFALFIQRITQGLSAQARFAGYRALLEVPLVNNLFGRGMDNVATVYMAGYARLVFYFGICGLLLLLYALFSKRRELDIVYSMLLMTFLIINIGEVAVLNISILLYLSFAFAVKKGRDGDK